MNPTSTPERFGEYEIVRSIGSGGMAEICLARHADKLVALKRLLPHRLGQRQAVELLLDEANVAAMLIHSNIVRVYDVGCVEGNYFIAMEYLQGANLLELARRLMAQKRGIPLKHVLAIVCRVLAALEYAHELRDFDGSPLQIVHRDLSPHNIFVTYDGAVKVIDFGIAKARSRFTLTCPGTLKGKLSYMSPEQCQSGELDPRSDIFTVAILLWEFTTGKRLYRAGNEFDVLSKIVEQDAPSPSSVRSGYEPDLARIVQKGLCRDVGHRYQSAREFRADLEALAVQRGLDVTGVELGGFMADLFGDEIDQLRGEGMVVSPDALDGLSLPSCDLADLACVVHEPTLTITPKLWSRVTQHVTQHARAVGVAVAAMVLVGVMCTRHETNATPSRPTASLVQATRPAPPRPTIDPRAAEFVVRAIRSLVPDPPPPCRNPECRPTRVTDNRIRRSTKR